MRRFHIRHLAIVLPAVGLAVLAVQWASRSVAPAKSPLPEEPSLREATHFRLDEVRNARKQQLREYLQRVAKLAGQVRSDAPLNRAFELRLKYHRLQKESAPPADARQAMDTLAQTVQTYCLQHYSAFYNILFVDREGDIFYAVRRQGQVGLNLFGPKLAGTSLSKRLKQQPETDFVDFEYSQVSREPSAYFVEPARVQGQFAGWFILQCSINRINDIFVHHHRLGRSGEAFLVNRDCRMLTDSRFLPDSSILTQHLSPENILAKFAEGRGRKTVVDYRGFRAMTSFEVCPVLGSQWLLIAKIDEAEVLTEHYRAHRERLRPELLEKLRTCHTCKPPAATIDVPEGIVVDIDEYRKARVNDRLTTFGVSTCTAIMLHLPGKFAYMGHASTYDRIYGSGSLDLLGNMLQRVRRYEIRPYRLRELQAVVVAPHTRSAACAIDKLVAAGLFLSQIRFVHCPDARSADVWHETGTGQTTVLWHQNGGGTTLQRAQDAPHLGELARPWLEP